MPITYTIDSDRHAIFLVADGVVTDDDLLSVARTFTSDPRYSTDMRMLSDYSKMTKDELSVGCIQQLAQSQHPDPKAHRAVLVTLQMDFGMVRMYEGYCELNHITPPRPFYSREKALAYLNEGFPPEKHIT